MTTVIQHTTEKDYDREFLRRFQSFDPIYDVSKLLDYHLDLVSTISGLGG